MAKPTSDYTEQLERIATALERLAGATVEPEPVAAPRVSLIGRTVRVKQDATGVPDRFDNVLAKILAPWGGGWVVFMSSDSSFTPGMVTTVGPWMVELLDAAGEVVPWPELEPGAV